QFINKIKDVLENASGFEMAGVTENMSFIEIGLDSLLLTQVALLLKKQFAVAITFRQLNKELGTLNLLAEYLENAAPNDTTISGSVKSNKGSSLAVLSSDEEAEIKKPFGAITRIDKQS